MPDQEPVRVADMTRAYEEPHPSSLAPATHPINPMVVFTVIYAFNDITEEMGPTRFVPGSHLSGRQPDPDAQYQEIAPELSRGSAVVFDGRLWHGGSLNQSGRPRPAVLMGYTGPQFRPILNFPFGLRSEVAEKLPDDVRKILGFRVRNGYGATDDFSALFATPGRENTGSLEEPETRDSPAE